MTRALAATMLLVLIGCGHAPQSAQAPARHAEAAQRSTDAAADAPPSTSAASSEPTGDEVRTFADLAVRDWMDRADAAIYRRMARRYRETYSPADLTRVIDRVEQIFGKLRTADFKATSVGKRFDAYGVTKLWTLLYAATTDKVPAGTHFARIDVIAEPQLAIASITIQVFTNGVPPNLR